MIRYNDFVGSDLHRWNDAMEGAGNFHVDDGFNRDADSYGNLACFANDDAVEIDGGQTNVRVFLNKFEGCLRGVSIQGCMSGPSYVFHNLLATGKEGDEEHGIVGAPDFVAPGAGLFGLKDRSPAIGHGVAIANFAVATKGPVDMGAIPFNSAVVLPERPIPVRLDRYQRMFSPADSGAAKPRSVTATVSGVGFASVYRIVQNDAFDWFRVAPRNGMLESGQ